MLTKASLRDLGFCGVEGACGGGVMPVQVQLLK